MARMRRVFAGLAAMGLLAALAAADVVVVSQESMGRMPTEGTGDFRLVTNKDLSRVAVMDRWGEQHKWYVVQNSLVWEFYNELDAASAQFTPDGEHLSLLARHDDQWFLIVDNKDVRALGAGTCRGLVWSVDGKHDACIQQFDAGQRVVLDGKLVAVGEEKMPFEEIAGLAFGADGRLAFTGRSGGRAYVVLEGKILGRVAADQILPAVFSGDGKHVVCGCSMRDGTGTQIIRLVDGVAEQTYRTPQAGTDISALAQSADGEHLAWGEWDKDGTRVVVDGEPRVGVVKNVSRMVLSTDGRHVAWMGNDASGGVVLVTDKGSWTLNRISSDATLTLSDDGRTIHCIGKNVRYDFSHSELRGWEAQVVASGGEGAVKVQASATVSVNGQEVDRGHFLEARVGDSQTAYILTETELPVQVNDKKLGEITRIAVHVTRSAPATGG